MRWAAATRLGGLLPPSVCLQLDRVVEGVTCFLDGEAVLQVDSAALREWRLQLERYGLSVSDSLPIAQAAKQWGYRRARSQIACCEARYREALTGRAQLECRDIVSRCTTRADAIDRTLCGTGH